MGKVVGTIGMNRVNAEKDKQAEAVTPPADEPLEVWECKCGCRLFYMTKYGHMCSECETIQVYS